MNSEGTVESTVKGTVFRRYSIHKRSSCASKEYITQRYIAGTLLREHIVHGSSSAGEVGQGVCSLAM